MFTALIIIIFVIGYLAIAFEHPLELNKAASALITGVLSSIPSKCSSQEKLISSLYLSKLRNL